MTRTACFVVFVSLLVESATAADAELKGALTVAGKEIALKHVLVLDFDDAEDMGDGPELRILFSGSEVSKSELEAPVLSNLDARAREGKLQGVLLRFNPKAESREVYGTTYAKLENPQSSMPFFTLGGDAGGVDSLSLEGEMLSGTVENAADGDADFGVPAYAFTIAFKAPVQKATPAKVLTGKEGMNSAPMVAYLKFEAAMLKGDLDTIRKMASPEKVKQMEAFIEQVGMETFLQMVKQMAPDPSSHEQNLTGVYIRGDRATIVLKETGGKTAMNLEKKGEDWMVN